MTLQPSDARSRVMRAVKSHDTKPEIAVRSLLHRAGYRFRLHRNDLPGKPDLTFPGRKAVVFVHGCFWHGHSCKRGARIPKTNSDYWLAKIARNVSRDAGTINALDAQGWRVAVVWECELADSPAVLRQLSTFLEGHT